MLRGECDANEGRFVRCLYQELIFDKATILKFSKPMRGHGLIVSSLLRKRFIIILADTHKCKHGGHGTKLQTKIPPGYVEKTLSSGKTLDETTRTRIKAHQSQLDYTRIFRRSALNSDCSDEKSSFHRNLLCPPFRFCFHRGTLNYD